MKRTTMSKQFVLTRLSPAYWRVTLNHPPLYIFGPATISQLNEIITATGAFQITERVQSHG